MRVGALPLPADRDASPADGNRQQTRAERRASSKWSASLLSLVLLGAILLPVVENWVETPRDDFPLSYYPMFTFEKTDRQRVTYLVVYDSAMNRFRLPYWYAGLGGMNQVRRQINKLVDRGQAGRLCRNVASRVARSEELSPDLAAVEVVTGYFLMTQFFAGDRTPIAETVRAQCLVPRG